VSLSHVTLRHRCRIGHAAPSPLIPAPAHEAGVELLPRHGHAHSGSPSSVCGGLLLFGYSSRSRFHVLRGARARLGTYARTDCPARALPTWPGTAKKRTPSIFAHVEQGGNSSKITFLVMRPAPTTVGRVSQARRWPPRRNWCGLSRSIFGCSHRPTPTVVGRPRLPLLLCEIGHRNSAPLLSYVDRLTAG
jgi:hypothetical protein